MDNVTDSLLSGKTDKIPEEFDGFAPLVGDWDCDYYDEPEAGRKRHVKGEWIFRRVLDGVGIQDTFIFPSRATRESDPQPDGEYGSAIRMYNKNNKCYDVVYTCECTMKRLTFRKEGDRLVGQVLDEENAYWIFSDITEDSFHWENIKKEADGSVNLLCEIFGKKLS